MFICLIHEKNLSRYSLWSYCCCAVRVKAHIMVALSLWRRTLFIHSKSHSLTSPDLHYVYITIMSCHNHVLHLGLHIRDKWFSTPFRQVACSSHVFSFCWSVSPPAGGTWVQVAEVLLTGVCCSLQLGRRTPSCFTFRWCSHSLGWINKLIFAGTGEFGDMCAAVH